MTKRTNDSLSRANRQRLTEARKQAFLEALRIHGVATRAAREASPGARGASVVSTFKDERARSAEFARAWDDAIEAHHGDLLTELYRRAMVGDQLPIQNAKGEVIGWRSIRSDKLLLEAVRAHVREFTPRVQTEATVEQTVTQRTPEARPMEFFLDRLLPENQEKMLEILQSEMARPDGPYGLGDAYRSGTEPSRNGHASANGAADRLPIQERER